jgi:hypothetical protein
MVAVGFLVSIPVSLVTGWAYLCWIVVPVADSIIDTRRNRSGEQTSDD